MSPAFEYLLKVSVSLAVVSLLYTLLLRHFTFYTWNRWYLRFASTACFAIPAIDINPSLPVTGRLAAVREIPSIGQHYPAPAVNQPFRAPAVEVSDPTTWIWTIIFAGMLILLVRLVMQYLSLLKIRRAATLISADEVEIYQVEKEIAPFSFGNAIFYHPASHSESDLKDIILHEYIHVTERHTSDVIFGEILCILNWYNPFAWLIRWSIRQNLEYIADRAVLESDVDRREYQYLLLKVAGYADPRLGNAFNMSTIKRRILMMNKRRTPRILAICFALIVPVAIALLVVFRKEESTQRDLEAFASDMKRANLAKLKRDKRDLIIAGLILDARTGKPLPGFPLRVLHKQKAFKRLRTNKDGFYFLAVPPDTNETLEPNGRRFMVKNSGMYPHEYTVEGASADYKRFEVGESRLADIDGHGSYLVIFVPRTDEYNAPTGIYDVKKSEFGSTGKNVAPEKLHKRLSEASEEFYEEQHLFVSFKDKYPRPANVITKFENAYFGRDRRLMGYVSDIEFYLDGEKVDYTEVNEAFAGSPYMLKSSQEYIDMEMDDIKQKRFYLTFDLYKPAPPAALMSGNVEMLDAKKFDLSALKTQPYMLDGFRQTFGVGSNMMPEKSDIVKVLKFKGRLARYYDRKLDEIWWIETRPAAEVFERPDFAALQ